MGTQSILLFEEKAFWSLQGNTLLWLPVRKTTPFPSITAEKQTLQSKKQGEQRFNYACYTLPTRIPSQKSSEPAILPTQTCWNRKMHGSADRKMGLQAKERRVKITILPCSFRAFSLAAFLGDIWVIGSEEICKTRFRTVTDRLNWW